MDDNTSLAVFAFPFAFALSLVKFYTQEGAASMKRLSFVLACICTVLPVSFLTLRVMGRLFPYAALGYCVVGVALLLTSAYRLQRL